MHAALDRMQLRIALQQIQDQMLSEDEECEGEEADENEDNGDEKRREPPPGEVNLESFKKFPPEHWGVEHESPSNWE